MRACDNFDKMIVDDSFRSDCDQGDVYILPDLVFASESAIRQILRINESLRRRPRDFTLTRRQGRFS